MRLYEDYDVIQKQKIAMILQWFYIDKIPPDIIEAIKMMNNFISRKSENTSVKDIKKKKSTDQQFDYEFDAEEIYVSFIRDYHIDLLETEFLHWHKFLILLFNLSSESPFKQKIKLRFADLKNMKGEQYAKASRAKREAQIPIKYTKEEEMAIKSALDELRR